MEDVTLEEKKTEKNIIANIPKDIDDLWAIHKVLFKAIIRI